MLLPWALLMEEEEEEVEEEGSMQCPSSTL